MINRRLCFCIILLISTFSGLSAFSGMETSYNIYSLHFGETRYTKYRIRNTNSKELVNVSLSIMDNAGFDIILYNEKNISILPKEDFNVGLELYCKEKVFFTKETYLQIKIQYGDQYFIEKERVKIEPSPYLWPLIGTFFGVIFSLVLLLLFRNYTKDDKND